MESKIEELKQHLKAVKEIAKETGLFDPNSLKYEFNDKLIEKVSEINAYFRKLGVSKRFPVTADMVRHKEVFGIKYNDDFIEEAKEDYIRTMVSILRYVDKIIDNIKINQFESSYIEFIKTGDIPSRIKDCNIFLKFKNVKIEMTIVNDKCHTDLYEILLHHSYLDVKFDMPSGLSFRNTLDYHDGWVELESRHVPWVCIEIKDFVTNSKEVAEIINGRIDEYVGLLDDYIKELR